MKTPGPSAPPLHNVQLTEMEEGKLSNGLTVLVVPDLRFPIVSVQLAFDTGRVNNPEDNHSLVKLALELVKEGTRRRTSEQIAEELDYWAIQFSAEAYMEGSIMAVSVLEEHLGRAMDLLADMAVSPVFPADQVEKTKARWRSFLLAQRAQPDFLAEERLYGALYRGFPYEKTILTVRHVDAADGEQIDAFYKANFEPSRAVLLFAGPVTLDLGMSLAEEYFGAWPAAPLIANDFPPLPSFPSGQVVLVDRPGSVQSRILLALRVVPGGHPEQVRLKVANQILGGGASSRLFLKLREEKGLTYGIYSRVKSYQRDGVLLTGASLKSSATGEAIRDVLAALRDLRQEPPSAEEIHRSQSEIIGSFVRQLETPSGVGNLELRRRLNKLPADYYRELVPRVQAVSVADVHAIARSLFDPDSTLFIAVGDRAQLEPQLKPFGPISVFDVNGRAVS